MSSVLDLLSRLVIQCDNTLALVIKIKDIGVRIPEDAIIPDDKITRYLLVQKARNDKSRFLAQAGFTSENPEALIAAIQALIAVGEAVVDRSNEYGIFYQVTGELIGVNGVSLSVVTIWLERQIDGKFQFVTLKPRRES